MSLKKLLPCSTATFKRKLGNHPSESMCALNSSNRSEGREIWALMPSLATYVRPNTSSPSHALYNSFRVRLGSSK